MQIMCLSRVSFLVVRVLRSRRISGGSVENNIQSRTKQLCGFRGSASPILLPPTLRRAVSGASTGLLLSWPGNGQHVVETAQGTLIGALPNYHVGSELALRLLEEFASPARINTTPRSLLNRRHYEPGAASNVRIHARMLLGMRHVCRNDIRALEIELDIYRFSKCGRYAFGKPDWSSSAHFPIVRARGSKALIKTTRRNARETHTDYKRGLKLKWTSEVRVVTSVLTSRVSALIAFHSQRNS